MCKIIAQQQKHKSSKNESSQKWLLFAYRRTTLTIQLLSQHFNETGLDPVVCQQTSENQGINLRVSRRVIIDSDFLLVLSQSY